MSWARIVLFFTCLLAGCEDARSRAQPTPDETDAGVDRPLATDAPWLVESGDSVFFVGNSYFGFEDRMLPAWVSALGTQMNPPLTIETGMYQVPGNNLLSWFFDQPESQQAIASGRWDVFVIMGEEHEAVDDPEAFHESVRKYHRAITAGGGKLVLFMTWGFAWDTEGIWFPLLVEAYEEIGKELNIPIIPVGLIEEDCNAQPYSGQRKNSYWYLYDDGHPNAAGTAINAYATFSMLTGINARGRTFDAPGNTNAKELLTYLSNKAWARVEPRLVSAR
jgi:hypothetical protein